jgi:hypothetical protein
MKNAGDFEYVKCTWCSWIHRVLDDDEVAGLSPEQCQRYARCTRCEGVAFSASSWAEVPVLANTPPFVRNQPLARP